ncbi:MAG: FAD-binding oxidoreductase [Gammaproteobacteria bacterium]|nr:FAD-binding oxidoreductase [Gammaproteobacteria bacterium]
MFPSRRKYVIVGAGIHGLSTAYHLAQLLKAKGRGDGRDIVILDKRGVAAGASGIACGVIRNNYYQPAMRELMAHSVQLWESDPEAYSYHPVGYIQLGPKAMREDIAGIAREQEEIGYESAFVEGERVCARYMKGLFHDWRAQGICALLHEKRGGYANSMRSMQGLAAKAVSEGVEILSGATVQGFASNGGAVTAVKTDRGQIHCDYVVIGAGPWVPRLWQMLELPVSVPVRDAQGQLRERPMWKFWALQEGTLGMPPDCLKTNDGAMPPVIHLDSNAPLYADDDGSIIKECMWGIYYKPDFHCGGIQGGAAPCALDEAPEDVRIDPYGVESPDYVVDRNFARMWVSALAHCHSRFEGALPKYRDEPSGGIGAFTPDNFPVFDVFRENCYVIADSNHGYKMLGVGKLVAEEIGGEPSRLLAPFRYSRYAEGRLHPSSHSPFPWS